MIILREDIQRLYIKITKPQDFQKLKDKLLDARVEKTGTTCSVGFNTKKSFQEGLKKVKTLI